MTGSRTPSSDANWALYVFTFADGEMKTARRAPSPRSIASADAKPPRE